MCPAGDWVWLPVGQRAAPWIASYKRSSPLRAKQVLGARAPQIDRRDAKAQLGRGLGKAEARIGHQGRTHDRHGVGLLRLSLADATRSRGTFSPKNTTSGFHGSGARSSLPWRLITTLLPAASCRRHQLDRRHLRTSSNPACVSHIVRPSTGCGQDENLAMTILFLRSTNRFWPWMPIANNISGSVSTVYHPLR